MKLYRTLILPGLATALFLTACGGGGGGGGGGGVTVAGTGGGGGIGGTGSRPATSSGTIDAFGSIFVNGVEFETDEAEITIDGISAGENALGLGMIVVVTGTVNEDGSSGTALTVEFDNQVRGPVEDVQPGPDGDTLLIRVLSRDIIVESTSTVFENVRFETIRVGDLLEVSGFADSNGRLRATRIERETEFITDVSEIEVEGKVQNLVGFEFYLEELKVDASSADLSALPGSSLEEGLPVEVVGTLDSAGTVNANTVSPVQGLDETLEEDSEASVQGTVTDYVSENNFRLDGVRINAGNAILEPQNLILQDGQILQAEGDWDGEVLRARTIVARRGRIEVEATVAEVDSAERRIVLQLFAGTVAIDVDSQTLLEDDTNQARSLSLEKINPGDFLEVEAIQVGNSLLATRIDREKPDEETIQGPVDRFTEGVDITVLGLTYSTEGAEFEGEGEEEITSMEFYAALEVNDLVKIVDEEPADGIADEVEFESEKELDGDDDFDESEDMEESEDDEGESGDEGESEDEEASEDEPEEEDEPEDEEEEDKT
jgi:hypothetical protein